MVSSNSIDLQEMRTDMAVDTWFAFGRKNAEEISSESALISSSGYYKELLDALPGLGAILNEQRQVIYANQEMIEYLGVESMEEILGGRPGEVLQCRFALKGLDGCGSSENCEVCGAANSLFQALKTGMKVSQECRIATERRGMPLHLDLKISVSPVSIGGKQFLIVSLADISDAKRRKVLERIFFHDILNLSGSLQSLVELIRNDSPNGELPPYLDLFAQISTRLTEEIKSQRELLSAENNELTKQPGLVDLHEFLQGEVASIRPLAEETNTAVRLGATPPALQFSTDRVILARVLSNMLKNAVEACNPGDAVEVGAEVKGKLLLIQVHNPGMMPRKVQLQVFQRSYSTKGPGRGIGTYSMKLLTEKYLNGKVYFESTQEQGTTFYIELPLE